ncbi:MAG: acyl carrier protein [Acidobacteria bacterium]|nr:acyl carrier protein [Acidobacteriota bacterium]
MSNARLNAKNHDAREKIERIVRTALARALKRPAGEIRSESDLEKDLGLDSLGMIRLNVAIEEELHITIPMDESPPFAIHTVGDLTAFLAELAKTMPADKEESLC